jgi:hypothetical protein
MLIALMFRFVTRKIAGVAGKLGRESFTSNDMTLSLDLKILARSKFFAKVLGMNACRAQVAMNLAANFFFKNHSLSHDS